MSFGRLVARLLAPALLVSLLSLTRSASAQMGGMGMPGGGMMPGGNMGGMP